MFQGCSSNWGQNSGKESFGTPSSKSQVTAELKGGQNDPLVSSTIGISSINGDLWWFVNGDWLLELLEANEWCFEWWLINGDFCWFIQQPLLTTPNSARVCQAPAIGANQGAQCLPNGPGQRSAHAGRIRIAPKKDLKQKSGTLILDLMVKILNG